MQRKTTRTPLSRPSRTGSHALVALVLGLVLTIPSVASAAKQPVLFYNGRTVVKPHGIDAAKIATPHGTPPFDETVYLTRRITWRGWGTSRAVGTGWITHCVIEYIPCSTKRGTVVLGHLWRNGCGHRYERSYRYIRWHFPGRRASPAVEIGANC